MLVFTALPVFGAEISNVTVSGVKQDTATISWDTDQQTDATINYGVDSSVGIVRDATFDKKAHTLKIENLDPSTTYHFRVVSTDAAGNKSATAGFVFTTKGTPADLIKKQVKKITDPAQIIEVQDTVKEVIQDVVHPPSIIGAPTVDVQASKVEVTWNSDRESSSEVFLVPESKYRSTASDPYTTSQGNAHESVKKHDVKLVGLEPSTIYHFKVSSTDAGGLTGESEDATFRTKSLLPEVTGVKVSRIQETSATVAWSTGTVKAKGIVSYTNARTKATKSVGNPVYLTNQSVKITGLEFGTRYTGIITATNEAGDNLDSKPFSFITIRDVVPPDIQKVTNESTLYPGEDTKIQTILTWITDEPAYCQVFYTQGLVKKEGGGDDSLLAETNPLTNHTQVIVGFAPATVYKFWVKCHDEARNESQSDDYVLITPIKEKNIIDVILENFKGTFGWVNKIGK